MMMMMMVRGAGDEETHGDEGAPELLMMTLMGVSENRGP